MNPAAAELNTVIESVNPRTLACLSRRGREIFFPAKGILGQAAQAKGKKINATIGIALEEDGTPLRMACVADQFTVDPKDALPYAPSYGKPQLRARWREMIYEKNPSLAGIEISNPVATIALTHGLSTCAYLFLDEGDQVISPELYWGNYRLVFQNGFGAQISTYNTFKDGGFDVAAMRDAILAGEPDKRVVLLNFPNNPTGYTPTPAEVDAIVAALVEAAEAGNDVVAMIDDAYFGLVYEEGIYKESIFARLADAHDGILAVKIDGATKEDYVWGLRVGFLTYGNKAATPDYYKALEAKTAGAVRGNVSNGPHLSQSLMLAAYNHPDYAAEKQQKHELLKGRYDKICDIFAAHPEYADAFTPLPFNSGYFMCLELHDRDPETIRNILLDEYSTGVIAAAGVLRLAFSAAATDQLEELLANVYSACNQT